MSTEFLKGLIRQLHAAEAVAAAYLRSDPAQAEPDGVERIDLYLALSAPFRNGFAALLAPLAEEIAFSGPDHPDGGGERWRVVTRDGVEWVVHLALPASTDGLQPVFDRRDPPAQAAAAAGEAARREIDLWQMAGLFWGDLHRAARAIARGRPFSAHGHLERCRRALIDLCRLALAPGEPSEGWEGADRIEALKPLQEWLVVPLDARSQWRSAHRLAAAYESLMLPLCERLGVTYPMAIRNLAFQALDRARPDQGRPEPAAGDPGPAESLAPAGPSSAGSRATGRMRVARGQLRPPS